MVSSRAYPCQHVLAAVSLVSVLCLLYLCFIEEVPEEFAYSESVSARLHTGPGGPRTHSARSKVQLAALTFQKTCNPRNLLPISGLTSMPFDLAVEELLRLESQRSPALEQTECPRTPVPTPVERKVGMIAFPGSGSTWFKHLLHQITGYVTGETYDLNRKHFHVLVLKTHEASLPTSRIKLFSSVILLIRNPFDANVAEYKRGYLGLGKVGEVAINSTSSKWFNYVETHLITRWPFFLRVALAHPEPVHFVFYEDLKTGLLPEMMSVASFLNSSYLDKFSFCCAIREQEGSFHREHSDVAVPNADLYTREHKDRMNVELNKLAQQYGDRYPILARRLLDYQL